MCGFADFTFKFLVLFMCIIFLSILTLVFLNFITQIESIVMSCVIHMMFFGRINNAVLN